MCIHNKLSSWMHYAISMKVLGQTHMWYVLKHIWSNFLNSSLFMWFWIFTHKKQKHKSKIKNKCIKRCMMHKCMTMKHLMHKGSYKYQKNQIKNQKSVSLTIGTLPHPNRMIVWNECLMRSETRVGKMRTGDAHK